MSTAVVKVVELVDYLVVSMVLIMAEMKVVTMVSQTVDSKDV